MTTQLTAVVRGDVQGVGFRDWVQRQASSLGLGGSTRNLPDGRVEVVAAGAREACESLLAALRDDSGPGSVADVDESWDETDDAPAEFRIG